jgi:hypothetical protein
MVRKRRAWRRRWRRTGPAAPVALDEQPPPPAHRLRSEFNDRLTLRLRPVPPHRSTLQPPSLCTVLCLASGC